MIKNVFVIALLTVLSVTLESNASFVICVGSFASGASGATNGQPFTNGGDFDGDVSGDQVSYSGGGQTVVLTTNSVSPDGEIGVDNDGLGVNALGGGDQPSRFDDGESWSFSFDTAGMLTDLDFGVFTSSGDENFTISSASLGTLMFEDNGSTDQFAGVDSDSFIFDSIVIPANEVITLSYFSPNNVNGNARLEGFKFEALAAAAVPEPSTFTLFGSAVACCLLGRGRRRI